MDIKLKVLQQAKRARAAAFRLAALSSRQKDAALKEMAREIIASADSLLRANAKDVEAAGKAGLTAAMVDRLTLTPQRLRAMAEGVEAVCALKDPVGEVLSSVRRPNGLLVERVRVPIGVVGIIYESRPNVTCDCAALGIKSGNAVVLKGGREALESNRAIYAALCRGLARTSVPVDALQFISFAQREAVEHLLSLDQYLDVVVPRGGEGLIRFVVEHSSVPVIKHYKGVCHTYVASGADLKMAEEVCFNAKVNRPGVCNAMEKMLVDEKVAARFLPAMIRRFREAGVEIRGDAAVRRIVSGLKPATLGDWSEEYLDLILAVKVVDGVQAAVEHINTYGSRHSDAIITRNRREADAFLQGVDAACVYVNASTRFTDGFQFGLGAEIGIATDKLHVRGPMGLEGLTTYKYLIRGDGQGTDMRKIGLFGGTFDPVHIGHLLMARAAMEQMRLDKVVFIPSCVPPHKKTPTLFSSQDRYRMVCMAIEGIAEFEVSDFEIEKGGKSYSVDTARYFRDIYPLPDRLFFIVGGDAIKQLGAWKDIGILKKLCSFVSVNRPGYPRGDAKLEYHAVTMNGIEMSSTEIRKRIQSGKSIQFLVPDRVFGYIKGHLPNVNRVAN